MPIFIKAIDGTKEYKDKHYISRLFLDIITGVGHENVVQIITDNAFVMTSVGSIVQAKISQYILVTMCCAYP